MSSKLTVTFINMKYTIFSIFIFGLLFLFNCKSENVEKENTDNNPYEFHIGGVLSSNTSEDYFKQTIEVMYTITCNLCSVLLLKFKYSDIRTTK